MTVQSGRAGTVPAVRHEVRVAASPERAFAVFTDGFGSWWPKTHTIATVPVERAIIEPHAGGRCYDACTDGSECDWGTVLTWEPPTRLVLAWQVDGSWSYEPDLDHSSRVTVTFSPDGDGTLVVLVHDEFERHHDGGSGLRAGVEGGWGTALDQFAAAVAEGTR